MTKRINQPNSGFIGLKNLLNFIALVSCWISVVTAIIYYALTANLLYFIIIAMWAPARYFFFDMSPSKLQKRPASLDRTIPLTIFVNYLSIKFPIPNGNLLASLCGFVLACGRAMINGYALLFFDTFSFLYEVKNDSTGIPLIDSRIPKLLDESVSNTESSEDQEEDDDEEKWVWDSKEVSSQMDQWDFPLRRYRIKPNYYFENSEVNSEFLILDDKASEEEDSHEDDSILP